VWLRCCPYHMARSINQVMCNKAFNKCVNKDAPYVTPVTQTLGVHKHESSSFGNFRFCFVLLLHFFRGGVKYLLFLNLGYSSLCFIAIRFFYFFYMFSWFYGMALYAVCIRFLGKIFIITSDIG